MEKITKLVMLTRGGEGAPKAVQQFVRYGAGTRASIYLSIAARTQAALRGAETPTWEDVGGCQTSPSTPRHGEFPGGSTGDSK